jgi:WD40 repeat protein
VLRRTILSIVGISIAMLAHDSSTKTIEGITHILTATAPTPIHGNLLLLTTGYGAAIMDILTGREVKRFAGLQDGVVTTSMSPDGRRVVTYTSNANSDFQVEPLRQEIQLWDSASGKLLLRVPSSAGSHIEWTPDGRAFFALAQRDKTQLWDAASGHELLPFLGAIRFNRKGSEVAVSRQGTTTLLDYPRRTERCTLDAWLYNSLAFSPDGGSFAGVVRDTLKPPPFDSGGWELRVWDAATCRLLHTFPLHLNSLSSVAFTSDGHNLLVNLEKPASATLLDGQTGKVIRAFVPTPADFVTDALLSPDGQHLLTQESYYGRHDPYERYFCSLWDVSSGQELHRWEEGNGVTRNSCAGFSNDSQLVPIVTGDHIQSVWSAQTGMTIHQFQ